MQDDSDFVDYYSQLQVDYGCDERRLELAYHYYAKLYHPDSGETGNVEKFSEVIQAYKVLRDPEARAAFDERYIAEKGLPPQGDCAEETGTIDRRDALDDAEAHRRILLQLYKRRRECSDDPGIPGWVLEEDLGCSQNHFEFLTWYLKAKGLVEITGQGTLAITIEGVDQVIAQSRTSPEKLLIEDGSWELSSAQKTAPQERD